MAWKRGPLPKGTYHWGGVVPKGVSNGFYFADFKGDSVDVLYTDGSMPRTLNPDEVEWYDNALELPPDALGGASRLRS
jgi:hypothetical protein